MSKHTTGRLEVVGNLVRTHLTDGGCLVAEFRDANGNPHSEEAKANAVLFSAAKELLEALEEARNGLLWYQDTYPEAVSGADDEAIARIDAAIAKATGK